jgi:hypothetical protein
MLSWELAKALYNPLRKQKAQSSAKKKGKWKSRPMRQGIIVQMSGRSFYSFEQQEPVLDRLPVLID